MANLTSSQIKDSYQSVLTTSETTSNPTTGTLQNGKGTPITTITIPTVVGNLTGNATTATSATSATTAGTVTTAAQPAITSVGTLTGLTTGTTRIVNATGGGTASNYLTIEGSIVDNSNVPGVEFKGGTLADGAYGNIGSGNGGLALSINSGYGASINQARNQIILNTSNGILFQTSASGAVSPRMRVTTAGDIQAGADNTLTMGSASFRWSEIFAGNGTINTSDATEKQDIASLDSAELAVAVALKSLVKKYRWIDSVQRKGDNARIHVGLMAQDVEQAFIANGLDPNKYGVFCKNVWFTKQVSESVDNPDYDPAKRTSATNPKTITITETRECEEQEGATRHERRGLRYEQVWGFIISAL
jgi:hypothetical protein